MIKHKKKKLSKSEELSLNSGLIIENSIKVSYSKNSAFINNLLLVFISFIGLFGTIFSFITLFNIEARINLIMLYSLVFFILFSVISILPDKFLFTIFPMLLIFLYIFKDCTQDFILGFKVVANHIADTVYSADVWSKYYEIPPNVVPYEYSTIFLIFCIFLLSGLICLFTIKMQSCVVGFLLTFPFIECGLYFGAVPNYVPFFMVVCYWISLLSITLSGCKKSTKNKYAGFVRVGNSFFAKSDCNFKVSEKIGVSTMIMCIVCALLSTLIVDASNYERSDKINTIRNDVKDAVNDFSLENASYMLSRLGNMISSSDNGMFNGTLGQKDKVEYKNQEKLSVTVSEIPKTNLYLKGYVGSVYTGNSWDKLNKKSYDVDIFKQFEQNNFYPQTLITEQLTSSTFTYDTFTIEVSPVNKNLKTTFLPYFSTITDDYSYVYDTTVKSKSTKEYSFEIVNPDINTLIYNNNFTENPNFDSVAYNDFISQYYLQVEDTSEMQEVLQLFADYISKYNLNFDTFKDTATTYTKLEYIKNFLCSNYEYTLSPGKTPLDKDYVLYFLKDTKKGFCSHFASAGTMLCRMLNIPARYVEGYYVSKGNFDGENYTVSVKDNMAHAWTEIFIDNLGWVSCDFTPGFNGNPTMADFSQQSVPPDASNDSSNTESIENVSQPTDTQFMPVTEVPTDITTEPNETETTTLEVTTQPTEHSLKIDPKTLKFIKHTIIILLSISLVVCFVILRRKYILKVRNEKLSSDNSKVSILESYKYIILILNYLGFKREDTMPYTMFAKEVSSKLNHTKDFSKVMEIVLKSQLSNLTISNDEKLLVNSFASQVADKTYESQSKLNKLIFKYILCLI